MLILVHSFRKKAFFLPISCPQNATSLKHDRIREKTGNESYPFSVVLDFDFIFIIHVAVRGVLLWLAGHHPL